MTTDLTRRIHHLINGRLFPLRESITADSDLYVEGLDSLTLMQVIILLEQEFFITISPEDLDRKNFSTVANIAELVSSKTTAT
jgi:acyl carrier protein